MGAATTRGGLFYPQMRLSGMRNCNARLLIARHAETAGNYAAAEMAHAQAVGDAGDYDCWAEIYDAVAVLQASPARTSGP